IDSFPTMTKTGPLDRHTPLHPLKVVNNRGVTAGRAPNTRYRAQGRQPLPLAGLRSGRDALPDVSVPHHDPLGIHVEIGMERAVPTLVEVALLGRASVLLGKPLQGETRKLDPDGL